MPEGKDLSVLPLPVRAEMKSLPADLADQVGAHLIAAGELIDIDPAQALKHARAARRRAARLTVTREALAEAAYAAGEWSTALNEFRSLRRMTGDQMWLPMMADCERALSRPQAALRLVKEGATLKLSPKDRIELRLVEAGARSDLGQQSEALRLLRHTLSTLPARAVGARVRIGYALADQLLATDEQDQALEMFSQVASWDTDHATDAAERVEQLNGFTLELGEDDSDDEAVHAQPEPESDPEPEPTSELEPEPESESDPEAEAASEPAPEPEPEAVSDPEPASEPEATSEPKAAPNPEPEAADELGDLLDFARETEGAAPQEDDRA